MSAENPLENNNEEEGDDVRILTPLDEMQIRIDEMNQNLEEEFDKIKNQEGSRQEKEKLVDKLGKKFTKELNRIEKETKEAMEIEGLVKLKQMHEKFEKEKEDLIGDFIIERNIRKLEGR